MNKTFIIIKREFTYRVKKKSFIILTILMPFIFAALIFVPMLLSMIKGDNQKQIAVMDHTGIYAPLFQNTEEYEFVTSVNVQPKVLLDSTHIHAVLEIKANLMDNPDAAVVYSYKEITGSLKNAITQVLNEKNQEDKLMNYNIPSFKEIMDDYNKKIDISTIKLSEDGNMKKSSFEIAIGVGMVFTFLIYMFVITYGGMVMQGVSEEKTNRIVELMISSVKPFQLMIGKIAGIGLVGLFQLTVWGIMFSSLLMLAGIIFGISAPEAPSAEMLAATPAIDTSSSDIMNILNSIDLRTITIMFVLNFVGGYLIYASLFAAIGASINEPEDSQQFMTPIIILIIFALYAALYSADNPEGPLAFWCAMIPFTSPIVSMVRIAMDVPMWETILSLVLQYASAFLLIWISSRIYRVGILMYGKKPTIREMIKWIKYN